MRLPRPAAPRTAPARATVSPATVTGRWRRPLAGIALGALAAGLTLGGLTGNPAPAFAAGAVQVSVEGAPEQAFVADPVYQTQLRLNGSGFQSIKNGFGGIYVLFGWVDGAGWAPSSGGVTGENYMYVPDDEVNPVGYANFVTFPGSSTSYAANGGEVAADGSWSAVATIPGAKFTSVDRAGNPSEVDCLQVQCGIITVGAHGVVNANNETFTPITFQDLGAAPGQAPAEAPPIPVPTPGTGQMPATTEGATPSPTPTSTTTEITEERVETVRVEDGSSGNNDQLMTILTWAILGVGVLAVGSIAFLVWAVLSGRRKAAAATLAGAAAAQPEEPVAAGEPAQPERSE